VATIEKINVRIRKVRFKVTPVRFDGGHCPLQKLELRLHQQIYHKDYNVTEWQLDANSFKPVNISGSPESGSMS
jgi:hypothetical protein